VYDARTEAFHALSCPLNKGLRTRRHNELRNLLFQLLRKRNPTAGEGELDMEVVIGSTAPTVARPAQDVRADIRWVCEAETLAIDIACVDPGAQTYLAPPSLSASTRDGAAAKMERQKYAHYAKVVLPAPVPANSVLPFVIEASGRLGPKALGFLAKVCGTQTYLRSKFLNECAMVCARYLGFMLKSTREQFQNAP
jgi:hypothetical protein